MIVSPRKEKKRKDKSHKNNWIAGFDLFFYLFFEILEYIKTWF
jgi:hypothetical protein